MAARGAKPFFCWLNGSENQLRQVERVEHFMEPETLRRLEALWSTWGYLNRLSHAIPLYLFPEM